MAELLTLENISTLAMLILLQAVLGFDNLLYISIESNRVEPSRRSYVRKVGIALAVILRIVLLIALVSLFKYFQNPLFAFQLGFAEGDFNVHAVIVLLGGIFILYTAMKEIYHLLSVDDIEQGGETAQRSVSAAIFWIVLMNVIFSFDSILSAMALTDVMIIITIAIIISGILMIVLADYVSDFLSKNRMYEVLGLFVLFIVGILLISEGGHLAHLKLFGYPVEPMQKTTFYFVIFIMVAIDVVQSRYRKKLLARREVETGSGAEKSAA